MPDLSPEFTGHLDLPVGGVYRIDLIGIMEDRQILSLQLLGRVPVHVGKGGVDVKHVAVQIDDGNAFAALIDG
jgi:hypothetical protein